MEEVLTGSKEQRQIPAQEQRDLGVSSRGPEKKESDNTSLLPRIADFPERFQPVVRNAFLTARTNGERLIALVGGVAKVIAKRNDKTGEQQEIIDLAEGKMGVDDMSKENQYLAKVIGEITLIEKAYPKIARGQDAPELREVPSPFPSVGQEVQFSEEEIKRHSKPRSVIGTIHRVFQASQKGHAESSVQFREKMDKLYYQRAQALLAHGITSNAIEPPFQDPKLQAIWVKRNEQDDPSVMITAYDTYYSAAKKVAHDVVSFDSYVDRIDKWVKQNEGKLSKVDIYGYGHVNIHPLYQEIINTVDLARRNFQINRQRFIENVHGFPNTAVYNYTQDFHDNVCKIVRELITGMSPIQLRGEVRSILRQPALSQDYVDEVRRIQRELSTIHGTIHFESEDDLFMKNLGAAIAELDIVQKEGEARSRLNVELGNSQDLLFHSGPWYSVRTILERGVLASRQYQEDHFGESNFVSGQATVGKDYVQFVDGYGTIKKVSKQEYAEMGRRNSSKTADQEAHQVCFSENGLYAYYAGVALAFSRTSLFTDRQFMAQDGWHLFDKEYSDTKKDSPGLAIDLTKEPFVIMVDERMRGNLEQLIRNNLSQDPTWGIEDVDKWIAERVVEVPVKLFHEISRDTIGQVRDRFFQTFQLPQRTGWVVPTGENGETAVKRKEPLCTYKQAA